MKTEIFICLLIIGLGINAQESVKGHIKKNGTYVQPHKRTNKDKTEKNNWSSKPNYNPNTGKKGTKIPKK